MSRARRAVLALAVTSVAACAASVSTASAADVVLPFNNYNVGGRLSLISLNQSITLPASSTFNGSANITQGILTGHVSIPTFTSTIRVLGIPTQVTTQLVEAQPVQGSVKLDPDFTTHIRSTTGRSPSRSTSTGRRRFRRWSDAACWGQRSEPSSPGRATRTTSRSARRPEVGHPAVAAFARLQSGP